MTVDTMWCSCIMQYAWIYICFITHSYLLFYFYTNIMMRTCRTFWTSSLRNPGGRHGSMQNWAKSCAKLRPNCTQLHLVALNFALNCACSCVRLRSLLRAPERKHLRSVALDCASLCSERNWYGLWAQLVWAQFCYMMLVALNFARCAHMCTNYLIYTERK